MAVLQQRKERGRSLGGRPALHADRAPRRRGHVRLCLLSSEQESEIRLWPTAYGGWLCFAWADDRGRNKRRRNRWLRAAACEKGDFRRGLVQRKKCFWLCHTRILLRFTQKQFAQCRLQYGKPWTRK